MSGVDGFKWCDRRWDGPGGVYDIGQGVENHVCAQHKPGHETHVCCCGAALTKPTAAPSPDREPEPTPSEES